MISTGRALLGGLLFVLAICTRQAGAIDRFELPLTLEDRPAWAFIAEQPAFADAVARAESHLNTPVPQTTDDLYLEFSRSGDRDKYQNPYFAKRHRLAQLVVAEAITNEGRYLDAIDRHVRAICDERVWCLPAHDRDLGAFNGVRHELDLFVAETSWNLAIVSRLLDDRLSDETIRLIDQNLNRRAFAPYELILNGRATPPWWFDSTNNWNAVCLAGLTGAALTHLDSAERRRLYVDTARARVRNFLKGFTKDGYCSEGPGYWNYGFGHYLMLCEAVRRASGGEEDWFARPKIKTIASYPTRIALQPGLVPPLSDCDPRTVLSAAYQAFGAARLGVEIMTGALEAPRAHRVSRLYLYELMTLYPALLDQKKVRRVDPRPVDRFDKAGVYVMRGGTAETGPFTVAIKAGHNGEHHNHNDVGSYALGLNGAIVTGDAGKEVYTAATFDKRRYESPLNNSYGHPTPVVAGQLQATGRERRGRVIATEFGNEEDRIAIDLSPAYKAPTLNRLVRTFTFVRGDDPHLVIEDQVRYDSPQPFETALITFGPVDDSNPGAFRLGRGDSLVTATLDADVDLEPASTTLEATSVTKQPVTRIGLAAKEPVTRATVRVTLRPDASSQTSKPERFHDRFDRGADRWELLSPATWRWNQNGSLEITQRESNYQPPHRSPGHVALIKDLRIDDAYRIEFRVKSTKDTGPHRDCCVFFGWQDPAHFYYVHLGARPDPHSGQVMVVNGAPRLALTQNTKPIPWDDGWHTVRLEHDPATGRIAVYFDDLGTPLMEVTDKTFGGGRVGIGSFDDMNAFDDVRVWSLEGE